ncbi:MAG TPA: NAD(P)-dependent alcohol dehydrogenase [Eubacteriaceae bacterium]|nr:NAD(P)-dependent alcohol dehydrogenase [Eubacteriaceae bacterium]
MKGFGVIEKGKVGWLYKEDPWCDRDEVLVEPVALAPCTSDIHSAYQMEGEYLKNRILGHESVGRIIEKGSAVTDFSIGDMVVIPSTTPTWKHPEIQDSYHQHAGGAFSGINFSSYEDGTFADKIRVRSADMNLALLPDEIKPETACMVTDMMTTGFHGAELSEVKFGDTVVVFGIGPVGLMAVAGAKLMGAGKLIAVGTRPDCIKIAKEYGATNIINYKEGDLAEQIFDLTDGKGVDASIVCGGNVDTFNAAFAVTKNGGNIANLNMFTAVPGFTIPIGPPSAFLGHKTLRGGLCPGGRRRMERLLSMVAANRVDPSKLITHRFYGLSAIEDAFYLMKDKPKDLIKPVVLIDA